MRAINLIPEGERRGAGGAAGRSGGAAYVLLGLLGVLVLVATAYTLQHRSLGAKRAELARVEATALASESRAGELASFTQFATLRAKRVETVKGLASSRFDWAHSLRELARVVPTDVWLTSLKGTVAPGVTLKSGGSGGADGLRAAISSPAIEIVGCTTDQDSVAGMLARMRLIDGVSRVALQSSVKADAAAGASPGGGSATSDDCRMGRSSYPQFSLVVFFDQAVGAVPTTVAGARSPILATGPTGATGPSGAPSTTPTTP